MPKIGTTFGLHFANNAVSTIGTWDGVHHCTFWGLCLCLLLCLLAMLQWSKFALFQYVGMSFVLIDVSGNGSCFYHCVARSSILLCNDTSIICKCVCNYAISVGRPAVEDIVRLLHSVSNMC